MRRHLWLPAAALLTIVGCGSSETATSTTTTTIETTTTVSTIPEGRDEAIEVLVGAGFEPVVAECVLDVLTEADLGVEDLADPDDEVESLIAGAIVRCKEANEPLTPDEVRSVLVQTLIDNAGLTPEQAECAVAGIEASGSTPTELLEAPDQLTALLGEVIPDCTGAE